MRFATQGGGIVEWDEVNKRYVFTEKPNCPGLEVGDFMPEEWGIIALPGSDAEALSREEEMEWEKSW